MDWRKSSYSDGTGGQCVETASSDDSVMIRDTTNRAGDILVFTSASWSAFTSTLK
jgi:hypothetical protein